MEEKAMDQCRRSAFHCLDENGRPSKFPQALRCDQSGFGIREVFHQSHQQLQCQQFHWPQVLRHLND